jgi:hypothetical protein
MKLAATATAYLAAHLAALLEQLIVLGPKADSMAGIRVNMGHFLSDARNEQFP